MLYAIIATDIANSLDQRLAARPAHLARLTQLQSEGRLVLPARTRPSTATIPAPPASAAA